MTTYALVHPVTKEVRYVGKTTQSLARRFSAHLVAFRRGGKTHVYRWFSSLEKNGLKPEILALETCASREALSESEQHWIAYLKFCGADLTNHTCGGDNHLAGTRLTEEHKRKISESGKQRKGWKISEEGRANIVAAQTKRRGIKNGPLSPEHRAKISAGNKGKKRTPEQRQRISEARRRRA